MNTRSPQGAVPRVEALEGFEALDPSADPALADLTRLTARICNCPVAAVMLVDGERRVYTAVSGTSLVEHEGEETPCETTIGLGGSGLDLSAPGSGGDEIFEIPDAYLDEFYAETGIPIGGHVYRFYAGAPLVTEQGTTIGTLFVVDAVPGKLDPPQREALSILSRQVVTRLELQSRVREMDMASRDHKRTDMALTVERNFVSAVLDTVGALVAVFDPAGRIVRFNRACETISGYESSELVGRYVWERLIPEEDVSEAMREFESIRAGVFPSAFENFWQVRDGGLRRIAWSATALLDAQRQVAFVIATGIDVTVQREAEETLIESEARYRLLVEGSLGMVCTHDLDGVLLSVNKNGAETIGRTLDQVVGHSLDEMLPDGANNAFRDYLAEIAGTGEAQGLLHMRHLDGSIRVIAYRNKLLVPAGYEPYVLGFGIDVTDKIRAEDELRALIRQSNSILESVGDGIYGLDLEGNVTVVNAAASEMLGYQQGEMLGRFMHDLIHNKYADGKPYSWGACPINQSLKKLETVRVSTEVFWRKDGTSFPVDYVARPQIDINSRAKPDGTNVNGKAVGVVVAFTDTTERRALDRMKDEFVSTVSHELRTPLTSLRAALGLIQSGTLSTRPEKTKQMLEIAIGNTERLSRLVNDILELERIRSGKAELHYTNCIVEELLRGAAAMLEGDADKAKIEFAIEAGKVKAWADPDRIIQAVTILISNAIKFSPEGSRIVLKATRLSGEEAQIEVRDSGRGIPEDKLEQIFDRFQQVDASDSRTMGGTGLGLAICQGIVRQHGGRIWVKSKPGQGSSFYFTLPTKPSGRLRQG